MPDPRFLQPKPGMTSLQAAALYLSDGATDDPNIAAITHVHGDDELIGDKYLKLDLQQKASLVEMMGFDFKIMITPRKIHVSNNGKPHFSAYCKLKPEDVDGRNMLTNVEAVNRLVDACLRLKIKHDNYHREAAKA